MQTTLKAKGLYTALSNFSAVPEGAMSVADNCSIDFDDLVESRRGFDVLTYGFNDTDNRANRYTNYQLHLIAHNGDSTLSWYADDAGWTDYIGTFNPVDPNLARVRFQSANSNLYFTTSTGIQKIDAFNGGVVPAGVPQALDMDLTLNGSTGFFTTNPQVQTTADTTSGSPTLDAVADPTDIEVGQYISGTGIVAGTTVTAITQSALVLTTDCTSTAGSPDVVVTVTTGIVANQLVTGTNIPDGTSVTGVSGSTITLSNPVPATQTAATINFFTQPAITMSANASASHTGTTLIFSNGAQVGYRGTWAFTDANSNFIESAPSQLTTIANTTGGTCNVQLIVTIPEGITENHAFLLYRTSQTVSATVTPLDEEQQVAELNPSSMDISNGYLTYIDIAPDSVRATTLYTSPSQQTISQANTQPPVCYDFCNFLGFTLYANTRSKQSLTLTILGVGSPNGVQSGDVLTIAGVDYTADSSEDTSTGHFKVFTGGTPAQNITDTANSLIRVINRYSSSVTYAYNISNPTGLSLGKILLQERVIGGAAFPVIASAHGAAYNPALPTSGTTVISTNSVNKNGILVSKAGQPEAVPTINLIFAGSADKDIYRIIPLRNYVLILKTDGIFQLYGTTLANFTIRPFDLTTNIIAPDSAVSLSNEVWMLSAQGVVSVSDSGVQIRSRPIENTILSLFGQAGDLVKNISFGVSYETARKYILFLPSLSSDTYPNQAYVFNTLTKCWTRWIRSQTCGFVNSDDDRLYLGQPTTNLTNIERKNNDYTDYIDEGVRVALIAFSGTTVYVPVPDVPYNVGDLVFQSAVKFTYITAIGQPGESILPLEVASSLNWAVGFVHIYSAIPVSMEWVPAIQQNPGIIRQWPEASIFFKRTEFFNGSIGFRSEISANFEDIVLEGNGSGGWGLTQWGLTPWGGGASAKPKRVYVPWKKQYCSQLSVRFMVRNAYSDFQVQGINLPNYDIGFEVTR